MSRWKANTFLVLNYWNSGLAKRVVVEKGPLFPKGLLKQKCKWEKTFIHEFQYNLIKLKKKNSFSSSFLPYSRDFTSLALQVSIAWCSKKAKYTNQASHRIINMGNYSYQIL